MSPHRVRAGAPREQRTRPRTPVHIRHLQEMTAKVAGDDIRQKLEFHHTHLELGALGYIETFLFYWSWGFFQKKNPPRPIFVFENTKDLKNIF